MRSRFTVVVLLWLFLPGISKNTHAIPNSFFGNGNFIGPVIPAQPVFGRDLTAAFFEEKHWITASFPGPWEEQASLDGQSVRKMTANPTLFGVVPMSVYSYSNAESKTNELAIHFLDAGQYFGYQFGGEKNRQQRESGQEKRSRFSKHYRQLSEDLRRRLDQGCGKGTLGTIGRSDELRTVFTQYQWEDFVLRLVTRPDRYVSIYMMRKGTVPTNYLDSDLHKLRNHEKQTYFSTNVITTDYGDKIIDGIPMFTQGNTPFCGIHSLAMTAHYLGLRVHPEALAAGADFKNTGSAKGSRIIDLYRGVGEEIDMKVSTSPRFDLKRARQTIKAGIPMIVWRRVSKEREIAHNSFQRSFLRNPQLELGPPTSTVFAQFPNRESKGSPSHASVITGFNEERNEVIFTEPWGEFSRNRRMRVEEMEATAYAVFYFKW